NEDVDAQGRNGQIGIFLLSFINAAGASREDFKDSGRLVLKRIRLRIGPASDGYIRIVKADMGRQADADLRVRVESTAAPAPQAASQRDKRVAGDQVMGV